MLIVIATYVAIQGVQAFPLPIGPRQLEHVAADSSSSSCDNSNCRTIWNIIWSCLLTIFACTWVSVHPNIPHPDKSGYTMAFLRRLQFMILALITPELVIVWAMRQLLVARNLAKMNYEKLGWTQAHGFFALMGGFMLYNDNGPIRTLLLEDLKTLARDGEIDFPEITKEEIRDRSSADMLSKGLIILQTGWFILQCIARHIQHLPITELELVTLAFAALNFATYALWWEKPLSVQCPVRVPLKKQSRVQSFVTNEKELECGAVEEDVWAVLKHGAAELGRKTPAAIQFAITAIIHDAPLAVWNVIYVIWNTMQRRIVRAWKYVRSKGMCRTIVNVAVFTVSSGLLFPFLYPIQLFIKLGCGDNNMEPGAKSVPQFYSGKLKRYEVSLAVLTAMVIATIFGGIHCIAWSFEFPSHTEQILWRTASLVITCVPAFPFVVASLIAPIALLQLWIPSWLKAAGRWLAVLSFIVCSALYIISRVLLLVLPFISLRSLPLDAYRTVQWTSFIPHI